MRDLAIWFSGKRPSVSIGNSEPEFRILSWETGIEIIEICWGIGCWEFRIGIRWKLRSNGNFFFRKAIQRLDWEREIRVCRNHPPGKGVIAVFEDKTLVFSADEAETKRKSICWVANSVKQKQANVKICQKCSGEIRQTKLQKSVELLFLERRHLPGLRWPVKTNIVFVIFSVNISYSNLFAQFIYSPKIIYNALLSGVWHIAVSFASCSTSHRCDKSFVNACFECLCCCYLYICLKKEEPVCMIQKDICL